METIKYKSIEQTPSAKYLKVYLEDPRDLQRFLGHGKWNSEGWVNVENNLVNQILLGIQKPIEPVTLKFGNGLTDYQKRDVALLAARKNMLNRNPMGLGKTVETIMALREMNPKRVIVIVPKSTIPQWIKAFKDWYPEAKTYTKVPTNESSFVVITNYEQLTSKKKIGQYQEVLWDWEILDEAHRIKNRKSQRTVAVKNLQSLHRMCLTGTPVLKRLDDLWSLLHFLSWQYSGLSYWNFVYYFCEITESFWGKEITGNTNNSEHLELLSILLNSISIYNSIEVAKGKHVYNVYLPMDKAQRKLYDDIRNLLLDELPEDCTIPNGAVCTMRLRQVTSCPAVIDKERKNFWGVKFMWLKDFLEDHSDTKVCVFTKFESVANLFMQFLKESKISAVTVTGKINATSRYENKMKFVNDKNVQVFVGTIDAIGQGFDELQKVCNVGVFIDKDFSPKINEQAEERLHRMGQDNPVFIYYLNCEKSFDLRVDKINLSKSKDIREALESE